MTDSTQTARLSVYLWTRLRQLGIRSVHGVPGDYNLNLLDTISTADLRWVGNCNELNAGYATDGYARVNGIGALVTTGGVGELSAINCHAGAFSEQVSLVHIVGSPALAVRKSAAFNMHHTLGTKDWHVFMRMFQPISAAQISLVDASQAPAQIDAVLRTCWLESRPVYIDLPADMANQNVDGSSLSKPLDLTHPRTDSQALRDALEALRKALETAKRPCLLMDMCAARQRVDKALNDFVRASSLPTFVTPLAQGLIDESLPNFGGLYAGKGSHPGVQDFVEGSDLVIHIGALDTDVTTSLGTAAIKDANAARLSLDKMDLRGTAYVYDSLGNFMEAFFGQSKDWQIARHTFQRLPRYAADDADEVIRQDWFWSRIGNWLRKGDVILTDTGTASFGILNTDLPPESMLINISFWASIGHSLPAGQGAALAIQDSRSERRTIIFQGDGSFQLTFQEISTMIKHQLKVIIFVICNNGYTIERAVHETLENYNDIAEWDYRKALEVFDPASRCSRSFAVRTMQDIEALLCDSSFANYNGVQLVELHVPELDIPGPLKTLANLIMARQARSEG